MIKRLLVIGAVALAVTAPAANAQRSSRGSTPIELGIDGGVLFGLDAPRVTAVILPLQDFRIGFLVTDKLELEPRLNFAAVHTAGVTATNYTFEFGVLYQPAGDRVGNGFYGRPFIGIDGSSVSGGGGSNSSGFMGLGLGLKIPFSDRRMATRMEGNYTHGFGNAGGNQLGFLLGLSFFTR
jgi:hypothetical protein